MTYRKKVIIAISILAGIPLTVGTVLGGLYFGLLVRDISTGYYFKEYPRIGEGHYLLDTANSRCKPYRSEERGSALEDSYLDVSDTLKDETTQSLFTYRCVNRYGSNYEQRNVYFRPGDIRFEEHSITELKIEKSIIYPPAHLHHYKADFSFKFDGLIKTSSGSISYSKTKENKLFIEFGFNINIDEQNKLTVHLTYDE